MSVVETVPTPSWVTANETPESVDHAKLCFLLRLAALYHNEKGSLGQLSVAIGLTDPALSMLMKRGQKIAPDHAVKIERLIGRELFPRELFRPDLFLIPTE
jgi:hypothetical protein